MRVNLKKITILLIWSALCAIVFEMLFLLSAPQNYKFSLGDIRLSYFLILVIICAFCIYIGQRLHIVNLVREKYQLIIRAIRTNYIKIIKIAGIYFSVMILSAIIELIIYGINKNTYNMYQLLFIIGIGCIIVTGILLWKSTAQQPEILYLVICLTAGIILASSLPAAMIVSWDDETHFKNSLSLSYFNGVTIESKADQISEERIFPVSFKMDEVVQQHNTLNNQNNAEINILRTTQSPIKILPFLYTQLGYIPSACGLFLGRLLHLPYFLIFIMGRVFNVFSYSIITYYAMKRLKSGKMILAVAALFPTNIFLASNYSYDTWVTSWTMLGMAYMIGALQRKDEFLSIKECVIMIGAFFIGLGPKAIYFPIFLILLLIPKCKYKTALFQYRFRMYVLIAAGITLTTFLLPFIIKGPGAGDSRGGTDVNSTGQVQFILNKPIQYAGVLINFLKTYLSFDNMTSYVTFFAYLGKVSGFIFIFVLMAVVMLTDHCESDRLIIKSSMKFYITSISLITVILISTALYVSFTPVGNSTVLGCQGRYLLPLVFPVLFVWGSHKIVNQINKSIYNSIVLGISSMVLLTGIWTNCVGLYL